MSAWYIVETGSNVILMNKKVNLKATETKATNSDFYNLFRPIAPSIDTIGKVAQIVSALTEAVTVWYITQSEMAGSSKAVSIIISILAMILVISVLELGGRKFLQVLTRAIVWKRLKNAWYIGLFSIVLAVTIGMGVISFNLSTNGVHHAFVSSVPEVVNFDDSKLKNEFRTNVKEITRQFDKDLVLLKENYADRILGMNDNYNARIQAKKLKVNQYNQKYLAGEKWAKSQAEKYLKQVAQLEAEKTTTVSKIQEKHTAKLESWQAKRDQAIHAERERLNKSVVKAETIMIKQHGSKSKKAGFWGSLFSFFVGFSVILAFVCIVSVEVYRRGSGIEVTYEEEEKDPSLLLMFWKGLSTHWDNFFRKRLERFAKVSKQNISTSHTIGFNQARHFAMNESRQQMEAERLKG